MAQAANQSITGRKMLALPIWGTKTGSDAILNFTIAFRIQRNLLPEKTTQINHLQSRKRWHFLFGKQNRKWRHFEIHHCVPHPEKPPSRVNGTNQSFTVWKLQALPVLRVKQEFILNFAIVFSIPRNLEILTLLYSSKGCWLPSLRPTDISLAKIWICLLKRVSGYSEKQKLRR